jgi:two-component system repressor protein LuxO
MTAGEARMGAGAAHGFVGESPVMQELYARIGRMAASKAPVFVTGESGTGKELCARAIHGGSVRRSGPFIAINCGAIPRDLMESEMFGHVKGSFTGAVANRSGAAKLADGGTLFLDEICELDPLLQTKLLRFLETSTIQRVGSAVAEPVDVRIVCATNRDPATEVAAGRFRQDLFFRLMVLPLHMPKLSDRGGDVILIARHLLARITTEEGRRFSSFAPEAEALMLAHAWPGNVRELQNVIRQAVVLNEGDRIEASMLPLQPAPSPEPFIRDPAAALRDVHATMAGERLPGNRQMSAIERDVIEGTIAVCGGSVPKAARVLGLSPSTIYRKRESWGSDSRH